MPSPAVNAAQLVVLDQVPEVKLLALRVERLAREISQTTDVEAQARLGRQLYEASGELHNSAVPDLRAKIGESHNTQAMEARKAKEASD